MRLSLLTVAISGLATTALGLVGSGQAWASGSTLTVCMSGPPHCEYATIQSAINAATNGATIVIGPGTYDEQLTIPGTGGATSLTLQGAGSQQTTPWASEHTVVDGNDNPGGSNLGTVIVINSSNASVSISDLDVTGGDNSVPFPESNDTGGGIGVLNGASLTLTDSAVYGNSAIPSGGGIDDGGTVTVNDSEVFDNNAGLGGGISLGGGNTLTLYGSSVFDNSAPGFHGGGIDNEGGTVNASYSLIYGNTTAGNGNGGGGIWNGGTVNLDFVQIYNNRSILDPSSTIGSSGQGGGVTNHGTLNMTAGSVSGNTAYLYGGGIYNDGTLKLNLTVVSDNDSTSSVDGYGGGIYNFNNSLLPSPGTATLNFVLVIGNAAAIDGGGIWNNSGITLNFSAVILNHPDNCVGLTC